MYIVGNTPRSLAGSRSVGRLLLKGSRDGRSVATGWGVARDLFVERLQLWNFVGLNKRPEEEQSTTQLTSLSSRLLSLLLRSFVTAFALVAFLFVGVWLLTCLAALPALNTTQHSYRYRLDHHDRSEPIRPTRPPCCTARVGP